MIGKYYDKILLGIALAILLAVFGYAALRPSTPSIMEFVDIPALRPGGNTFEVSEPPELNIEIPRWHEPTPQSAGPEWVFDVFTPPLIHFNVRREQFIIEGEGPPPPDDFGLELVAISQGEYRIQVLGWIGSPGDYLINFEDLETGDLVMAREGREYSNQQIAVRSFKVEQVETSSRGGTPIMQEVGTAVIYDARLDREVTLRSDERKKDDQLAGIFRATEGVIREFRARTGDTFPLRNFTYSVDALTPPASATVTRTSLEGGAGPQTRILIARQGSGGAARAGSQVDQTGRGSSTATSSAAPPDMEF